MGEKKGENRRPTSHGKYRRDGSGRAWMIESPSSVRTISMVALSAVVGIAVTEVHARPRAERVAERRLAQVVVAESRLERAAERVPEPQPLRPGTVRWMLRRGVPPAEIDRLIGGGPMPGPPAAASPVAAAPRGQRPAPFAAAAAVDAAVGPPPRPRTPPPRRPVLPPTPAEESPVVQAAGVEQPFKPSEFKPSEDDGLRSVLIPSEEPGAAPALSGEEQGPLLIPGGVESELLPTPPPRGE